MFRDNGFPAAELTQNIMMLNVSGSLSDVPFTGAQKDKILAGSKGYYLPHNSCGKAGNQFKHDAVYGYDAGNQLLSVTTALLKTAAACGTDEWLVTSGHYTKQRGLSGSG